MWEIAKNTLKESFRMKILYVGIIFAVIMIFSSYLLSTLTINQGEKTMVDFGLSGIELFSLLLTLSLGGYILYNEFTQNTVLIILARIKHKYYFILGKFIGFAIMLFFIYFVLTLGFIATLYLHHISFELQYLGAIFLSYMKILVVLAFVLFFSTFVSPFLALLASLFIYLISHSTAFIYFFSLYDKEKQIGEGMKYVIKGMYYILPNFQDLSMKEYFLSPRLSVYSDIHFLLSVFVGALAYIVILLILASFIFNKKEF